MHSSRMRTARLLIVTPSMHCAGSGVSTSGPRGFRGVSAPGRVSAYGLGRGVCVSQHAMGQTPPPPHWTEFLTRASENITLAQLRCGR